MDTMSLPTPAYASWDILTRNAVDGAFEENIRKFLSYAEAKPWREINAVPPSMVIPVMNVIQKVRLFSSEFNPNSNSFHPDRWWMQLIPTKQVIP